MFLSPRFEMMYQMGINVPFDEIFFIRFAIIKKIA